MSYRIFQEKESILFDLTTPRTNIPAKSLYFFKIELGDSISWNSVALIFQNYDLISTTKSGSYSGYKSDTINIGLYSLTGNTLNLVNSASISTSFSSTAGGTSTYERVTMQVSNWMILTATSATSNLTPGNWFLAYFYSTNGSFSGSGGSSAFTPYYDAFYPNNVEDLLNVAYGGPFYRGKSSTTVNALPASVATSNLTKSDEILTHPYILIMA